MNILFLLTPKSDCAYVREEDTIRQALERMSAAGFAAVPILAKDGTYRGTLTEGDLLWAIKKLYLMDMKEAESHGIMEIQRRKDQPGGVCHHPGGGSADHRCGPELCSRGGRPGDLHRNRHPEGHHAVLYGYVHICQAGPAGPRGLRKARRGTGQAEKTRQPGKGKVLPRLSVSKKPRRVSLPAGGGKKVKSFFPAACTSEKTLCAERASQAPRGRGASAANPLWRKRRQPFSTVSAGEGQSPSPAVCVCPDYWSKLPARS